MYRYRDGQHPSSGASLLFAPFLAGRKFPGGDLSVRNQPPAPVELFGGKPCYSLRTHGGIPLLNF